MDISSMLQKLRLGSPIAFPPEASKLEYARCLDEHDSLKHLREEFIIPNASSLKKTALDGSIPRNSTSSVDDHESNEVNNTVLKHSNEEPAIYFCGNSLGVQPKAVRRYVDAQLETWASIGVKGHFRTLESSPLVAWQHMAEDCARKSADIVGASPEEIVIMNTLTANLHFMMASFYKPTAKRHKIILEWKPFPSDHYTIESQIQWHGLDPSTSMVQIQPDENFLISTEYILATIDEHAEETALILLPGIQYYSGQLFDMPRITKYAQEKGIVVGWDLAHAAGNVELRLHDWNVDFACWCTYKYMNAGPGSIAGAFVHERHGRVEFQSHSGQPIFRHRLAGWYGGDISVRFNMDNKFRPTAGAGGYQLSNPSAIDLASLSGALSVFNMVGMSALRSKSLLLTAYAEYLLDDILSTEQGCVEPSFRIITPRDPNARGAQLSILLREGLLDIVGREFEEAGIVCDQRKPDVIRVAPVPLYCTFMDVWKFMGVLRRALGSRSTTV